MTFVVVICLVAGKMCLRMWRSYAIHTVLCYAARIHTHTCGDQRKWRGRVDDKNREERYKRKRPEKGSAKQHGQCEQEKKKGWSKNSNSITHLTDARDELKMKIAGVQMCVRSWALLLCTMHQYVALEQATNTHTINARYKYIHLFNFT